MLNQHEITSEILRSMTGAVARVIGTSHASDVADCVSDAIVKILASMDSFDSERGEFKGWCSVIASNTARNWRKASANRGHDSEADLDSESEETTDLVDTLIGDDGRETIARAFEAQALASAIATLDSEAQGFLAALSDGMGQCEAGATVGWSAATTTRRYRAIVATLAERMA